MGTIPETYRCSYTVDFAVANRSAGTAIWGQIDRSGGIVRVYLDSGSTSYFLGSACYIIDE